MRERVRRLRTVRASAPSAGPAGPPGEESFRRMAQNGMDALERFGTELEAMLTGPPPGTVPPVPRPMPIPMQEPPSSTIGELEAELSRVLMDEGIVVRAHDVERVVALMAGKPVQWQR
jgi:hypothetical protein